MTPIFLHRIWGTAPGSGITSQAPFPSAIQRRGAVPSSSSHAPSVSAGGSFYEPFEALNRSPDRSDIPVVSLAVHRNLSQATRINSIVDGLRREQLAGIARHITDNYAAAGYALGMMADWTTPAVPRATTKDKEWNRDAELLWDNWAEGPCDFQGRFDLYTLQRLICAATDTDGDVGQTMDESRGFPQLRLWPCWRIGSKSIGNTSEDVDGVLVDLDDVVTGYRVLSGRDTWRTFDRNQMTLIYEPNRIERFRGLSALRFGANDLRDMNDLKAFVKLGAKIHATMAAVINGRVDESDWDDPENPSPGPSSSGAKPRGLKMAQLFGGDIPVIDGELKQLTGGPADNKLEFMEALAGMFVSGLGIPPAFYLDEKLTGPNIRSVLGKATSRFSTRKRLLGRATKWTWVRFIAWQIRAGNLTDVPGWQRCRVQGPPLPSIDLGDQSKVDRESVANGLMSRQRFHSNLGNDWEEETSQIMAEDEQIIQQCATLAERTKLPIEVFLGRHGFPVKPKAEAKPNDNQPAQ